MEKGRIGKKGKVTNKMVLFPLGFLPFCVVFQNWGGHRSVWAAQKITKKPLVHLALHHY